MFLEPDITDPKTVPAFKWKNPDEEGMIKYMADEKHFSVDRVTFCNNEACILVFTPYFVKNEQSESILLNQTQ